MMPVQYYDGRDGRDRGRRQLLNVTKRCGSSERQDRDQPRRASISASLRGRLRRGAPTARDREGKGDGSTPFMLAIAVMVSMAMKWHDIRIPEASHLKQ